MGRSVSVPTYAAIVAYKDASDIGDEWEWNEFKEGIVESAKGAWPSLTDCDKWEGMENHIVLENSLAQLGLSEYCGLVSIWFIPNDDETEHLANHWINQVSGTFNKLFGEYEAIGAASNGETFYKRAIVEESKIWIGE